MRWVVRGSVRRKLMTVVLATTLMALLVAASALLYYELRTLRETWISDLGTQADILARTNAPALSFQDRAAAQANLALLEGRPNILAAALYTADGRLFATFSADPQEPFPDRPDTERYRISGDNLFVTMPVMEDGDFLGTVYLRGRAAVADRLQDYLVILVAVMAGSLIIAVLFSRGLQAGVTEPILALTDAARHVMQTRDFTHRVPKRTNDEIGVLVDAFNAMVAEIGENAQALASSNALLKRETEERRAAEQALLEADRRKDEFLATLAHELRNPLAPMVNALSLLNRPDASPELAQRAREMMSRQLSQMIRLVDDLLDVSRITTGKLGVHREPVELGAILRGAVESARPAIEGRRHELALDLPAHPVHVLGDATRLTQVFANLLNNAAKYTNPGGHIRLGMRAEDEIVIEVADDGIGIPAHMLTRIFDMFTQVDNSIERSQAGLGVGLALARRLVELHEGTIEARSHGEGRGSTFIVRLPQLAAITPQTPADRRNDAPAVGRLSILLVDDNVDYVTSLADLLRGLGHDVRFVHDGPAALAAAREFRPRIAFLDIGLPGMSGYEVARRLRAADETAGTFLVAVTGWGQDKDRHLAKEAGFDRHLVKPVSLEMVQSMLDVAASAGSPAPERDERMKEHLREPNEGVRG